MENLVKIENNEVVVSSRQIADNFGKEHKNVLRNIDELVTAQNCALTPMFHETTYTAGTGREYKEYLMTRDGFSLLVMGFTGKAALEWKIKYIQAFNEMEAQLKNDTSKIVTKVVTTISPEELKYKQDALVVRKSELWMRLADRSNIPEYKQVADSYAANTLAGKEVFALPEASKKTYSATEIGELLGVTANKIGRLAKNNNLKTAEYGKLFYDKAKNCSKQVETFRYYSKAIDKFRELV
jgi:Rha family phage regulatory protein